MIASGGERSTADQRVADRPPAALQSRLPLAAIVDPRPAHGAEHLRVERLTPRQAVLELVSNPRTIGWINPDPVRKAFAVLAGLAEVVPVYRATVPWGLPFPPDLGF